MKKKRTLFISILTILSMLLSSLNILASKQIDTYIPDISSILTHENNADCHTHTHTDETDVQEFSCLSVTSPQNQYYSILSTKNKSFTYAEQTSSDFETDKSPNSDINKSDLDTNESDSSINEPDPNSNEFGTSPNEESVTSISESPAVSTNEEISATGSELNESNTIDENANISVGATGISGVEEYEKTFVEGGNKYKVKVTLKASSQSTNDD